MSAKIEMYNRIRKHGEDLKRIFGLSLQDPVRLCKSLLRLENKAHRITEDYANGKISTDDIDKKLKPIEKAMDKLLHNTNKKVPTFINQDPRGYALKIEDSYARNLQIHRDWGGYGIIAPDLRSGN